MAPSSRHLLLGCREASSAGTAPQEAVTDADAGFTQLDLAITDCRSCLEEAVKKLLVCHNAAASTHAVFIEQREKATECVRVFNTTHFPFTERLLASVKNMMEMYAYTDFQAFKESIHEIAEEVGEYALYAEKVGKSYEELLHQLNEAKAGAEEAAAGLQNDVAAAERRVSEALAEGDRTAAMRKRRQGVLAGTSALWAVDAILFVGFPVISGIAGAVAGGSAVAAASQADKAQQAIVVARQRAEEAKRKGQEAQYAADCIIGPLRDSLDSFTDAVKCIAGFLHNQKADLITMAHNLDTAQQRRVMQLHHQMFKGKAQGIIASCSCFLEFVPGAKARLACIEG